MTRERFTLNDLERASPVWLRIKAHIEEEMSLLRQRNDTPTLDERNTALIRGEIAALKKLLAAEKDRPTGD